ncbi:expressed unknown protein [Seminavis robusta]|uniref:Uncharacterized protein n=1 Tax=Seminavis robusta TaxID=568900 RepID=A0A9N8DSD8_9STRA|nr:expressed unknown protein [Seminavis robusta]|eukprot:Sro308_g113510.1 n/a (442) ;mRNA; f:18394-19719
MARLRPTRRVLTTRRKRRSVNSCSVKVVLWLVVGVWIGIFAYFLMVHGTTTTTATSPTTIKDQSQQEPQDTRNLRENQKPGELPLPVQSKKKPKTPSQKNADNPRFLVFLGDQLEGQGAGNLMNGLLAAHLLGDEFGRIVCVTHQYTGFHQAWKAIHPVAVRMCSTIMMDNYNQYPQLFLLNFHKTPVNECYVQQLLASDKEPIIALQGNTYPRWAHVPPKYFLQFYQPKRIMLDVLPYNPDRPPRTVIHLRKEDAQGDVRYGLDDTTLKTLAKLCALQFPEDKPYLITNHVPWFDELEERYGWRHPDWQMVTHSASQQQQNWGSRHTKRGNDVDLKQEANDRKLYGAHETPQAQLENLQLWADWYTLLHAKRVFHTVSDFSTSAVHWMGTTAKKDDGTIESYILEGLPGHVQLNPEYFRREDPAIPLVERTADQLQHCYG